MCEHLHRNTFNPFSNGKKNGLKNVMCEQGLRCCKQVTLIKNINSAAQNGDVDSSCKPGLRIALQH